MNIIQCKMCRKPFHTLGSRICPDCLDEIEKDYAKVRDYIYDNPRSTSVEEVSENTGVTKATILHLLKEGRLVTGGAVVIEGGLVCEMCHRPIMSGKICTDCKKSVSQTIQKSIDDSAPSLEQDMKRDLSKGDTRMHSNRAK